MRTPAVSPSRTAVSQIALVLLGLAPIALMICTVVRLWLPLPWWDEWATPGENLVDWCKGHLTFQELFAQHNESRKFFPRLLYLALAQIRGWDVREAMAISLLIVCGVVFLTYRLLRGTPGASSRSALVAWVIASFLCFSPAQVENFLWGIQLEVFFPGLAVLLLVTINLSSRSLAWKAALNAALAFITTYTVAHGMLLWLLGVPLPAAGEPVSTRRRLLVHGIYLLCAAAAIRFYLVGYARPAQHPRFLAGHPGLPTLAHYLALWVGSYFNSSLVNPLAAGILAIVLMAAALGASLWLIAKKHPWRTFYPGLIVAAYASASAAITAIGRIGFGVQQALENRYLTYSLFFYLALVLLWFAIYGTAVKTTTPARRRAFLGVCAAVVLVAAVGWGACFRDAQRQEQLVENRNRVLLRALEWIDLIPDNRDLLYLFPKPEKLLSRIRLLRQHHLLPLSFAPEHLLQAARQTPKPRNGEPFGQLETCVIDANHNLWITGRAQLPDSKQPPDCIIIGAVDATGFYTPISIVETERPRGGGKTRAPADKRLLFGRTLNPANLPEGDVKIAAWAVDLKKERVLPRLNVVEAFKMLGSNEKQIYF